MTPNAALNVILSGHGAKCSSYSLTCRQCDKEHEATEVIRALIVSASTEATVEARVRRELLDPFDTLMGQHVNHKRFCFWYEGAMEDKPVCVSVLDSGELGEGDDIDEAARNLCRKLGLTPSTSLPETAAEAGKAQAEGWVQMDNSDPDQAGWYGLCWVQFDDGSVDEKRPHYHTGSGVWRVAHSTHVQHAKVVAWCRATAPLPSPPTSGDNK